jgi:hypothetical protein
MGVTYILMFGNLSRSLFHRSANFLAVAHRRESAVTPLGSTWVTRSALRCRIVHTNRSDQQFPEDLLLTALIVIHIHSANQT